MRSAVAASLALLLITAATSARVRLDLDLGHALARAWCASCHAVEPGQRVGPFAGIPSFASVAQRPSTTAASLHAFLTSSHRNMPDVRLKPEEIDEVVDYILRLKEEQ
jgi:cytochrome c